MNFSYETVKQAALDVCDLEPYLSDMKEEIINTDDSSRLSRLRQEALRRYKKYSDKDKIAGYNCLALHRAVTCILNIHKNPGKASKALKDFYQYRSIAVSML